MPRKELSRSETLRVLAAQKLVRIAFRDGQSSYLVPLGYVWVAPVLCGVTDIGRKTRLAEKEPLVSFQVDTSSDTGLWEWRSVTGEGKFEIVDNDEEKQQLFEALQQIIGAAPDWWRAEQGGMSIIVCN